MKNWIRRLFCDHSSTLTVAYPNGSQRTTCEKCGHEWDSRWY